MVSLILVGKPQALHIMAQAMVPKNLEPRWAFAPLDGLSEAVGGRIARWITARSNGEQIRLLKTRKYVGQQTALHADWLVFREAELVLEFLRTFPHLQVSQRIEALEKERKTLHEKTEERLRRGGFDLGKFPAEQRRPIAQKYIDAHDKLRDLGEEIEELRRADNLRGDWEAVLAKEVR